MLLFSTLLDIKKMTDAEFIQLVITWNKESDHKENIIPGIQWKGERKVRYGSDGLWLDINKYADKNIVAVRHEKKDAEGTVWDTDFVMNFDEMKMAVRLDRSYTEESFAAGLPFSTPHFITYLIKGGYLKDDATLPVARDPVRITRRNIDLAADVINGKSKYRLPVVYVSKTSDDEYPVDTMKLAGRLKGIAHVLTQESKEDLSSIRKLCGDNNEYFGAIGIYFPSESMGHKRYMYRASSGYDSHLFENVIHSVMQYSNSLILDDLYTWQGVNNAILMRDLEKRQKDLSNAKQARKKAEDKVAETLDTLDEQKKKIIADANKNADDLISEFDDEVKELNEKIKTLTIEKQNLQRIIDGLKNKSDAAATPVLFMGDEKELYDGEIKDLLLAMIDEASKKAPKDTRRADIAHDIIDKNDYKKESERRADEVKKLLRNYDGMDNKTRQELEKLGFNIERGSKHYKVTYFNDRRYHFIFSTTPSDIKTGENSAQEIIKKVY